MEKGTSFLFSGITFDKKKFAADFARFKEKKESDDLVESGKSEAEEGARPVKKRKRKATVADPVEGFNVFKASKSSAQGIQQNDQEKSELSQAKKELNRQIERDALLRKKHNIHISGNNVPSPLENFSELSSRGSLAESHSSLGRECFACAPTGSGKTLAFVCPMLMKLKHASKDGIRAVILCPTRELAAQTARESKKLAKGKKFYIKLLTKELLRSGDISKLPCDILISTPLRLRSAIHKKKLDLSRVEYLVLDESDKLFELGLVKQIDAVVKACSNPSIIRSLFSATLPDFVEELARTIMHDAVRVIIGRKNSASELIKQKLVFAGSEEGSFLLFVKALQSKERAKELYTELAFDDIRVDVIHADLSNHRAGKTWVLIATDVIARGMDFKGINCVINYDFPDSPAAYIHRIGRSGRAGRTGEAITIYTEDDVPFLRNIANVMAASGCEVPSWIMALPKLKWKKHRPQRDSISTKPKDQKE
ncbi:DEAD-box ATP-dependent RNA helicase 57 [Vitis vinifera]|uniref:RNA helicase n=1 Tax=Vitis vinifera TaxID=29760 RepID=A0A438IQ59_VITVI|nr:DEAD-box ATP-dependent RNA helicase 57 [Vitis vinifera]